jgi:hypothetical protein
MVLLTYLKQRRAEQQVLRQVKEPVGFLIGEAEDLAVSLRRRYVTEIKLA